MHFLVHSSKTKQFLFSKIYKMEISREHRALWTPDMNSAVKYQTPSAAYQAASKMSATSKAHVVLWDGVSMWNVSESKA